MTLRVLVIESEAEELLFLQDVLREIEQERLLPEWPQIEPLFAANWAEAERILSTSPPHAILLDLELDPDGKHSADEQCTQMFGLVQTAAADVPVILLLEAGDEPLATRLMRKGAEDFLLKGQIDCAPLAHALRNAVLRRRLLSAARASSLTDSLTGLANRAGFLGIAARDRKLAERLKRRWMLLVAKPRNLEEISRALGEQRRDLELVEAAEQLRGMITPADLAARIDDRHFAVGVFDTEVESVEEAWLRMRHAAAEVRMDVGASIFDPGRPLSLDAVMELAMADLPQAGESKPAPRAAGAA
jgi:two-component system, cell cycle response regulator